MNKIAFQLKADYLQTGYTDMLFCFCDLDLDPMTFIYKLHLDKQMHLCILKMNFLDQDTHTETDTQTDR